MTAPEPPSRPRLEDLDFTSLLEPQAAAKPRQVTAAISEEGLIGQKALETNGYHVVVARERGTARAGKSVVLVVEDDDDTAQLAVRTLQRGGYATGRAADARETSNYLAKLVVPELILLDVQLPGMDGFEMLARMRAHPKLKNVPIVLFTSRSSREDVVRGLTLGADGYIAKPVAPKVLLEVVGKVLMAGGSGEPL